MTVGQFFLNKALLYHPRWTVGRASVLAFLSSFGRPVVSCDIRLMSLRGYFGYGARLHS